MRKFFVTALLLMIPLALVMGKPTKTRPLGVVASHPYSSTADNETLFTDTIVIDNTYYSNCIIALFVKEISGAQFTGDTLVLYLTPYLYSASRTPDTLIIKEDTFDFVFAGQAGEELVDTLQLAEYLPWYQAFKIIVATASDPGTDTTQVYPFYIPIQRDM